MYEGRRHFVLINWLQDIKTIVSCYVLTLLTCWVSFADSEKTDSDFGNDDSLRSIKPLCDRSLWNCAEVTWNKKARLKGFI